MNRSLHTSETLIDLKFLRLLEASNWPKTSRTKIQKVAEYRRNRKYSDKPYSPRFVSIGPIHHDNPNLKLGENYKLIWAAKYIRSTKQDAERRTIQDAEFLHEKIFDKIEELKSYFASDVLANTAESIEGFRSLNEKLSWLLFVDGCSLLYLLSNVTLYAPHQSNHGISNAGQTNYYQEHLNMNVDQLVLVMTDVLLSENQLPYIVLKLLWRPDVDENLLMENMENFLKNYHWAKSDQMNLGEQVIVSRVDSDESETPIHHLLDLQHKIILLTKSNSKSEDNKEANNKKIPSVKYSEEELMRNRNIQDLTAVGINLISSGTRSPLDVDFLEGWFSAKLILPQIVLNDSTYASIMNLIAYEMCPDFKSESIISSFMSFMNSLIDHADDVKKLKSLGILVNSLGSDEEVADLFNSITTNLVANPNTYFEVRDKIDKYHSKKYKIWISLGYHTYFSNPWAITGFLAAFMALTLTFVQTWFSIFPSHN